MFSALSPYKTHIVLFRHDRVYERTICEIYSVDMIMGIVHKSCGVAHCHTGNLKHGPDQFNKRVGRETALGYAIQKIDDYNAQVAIKDEYNRHHRVAVNLAGLLAVGQPEKEAEF